MYRIVKNKVKELMDKEELDELDKLKLNHLRQYLAHVCFSKYGCEKCSYCKTYKQDPEIKDKVEVYCKKHMCLFRFEKISESKVLREEFSTDKLFLINDALIYFILDNEMIETYSLKELIFNLTIDYRTEYSKIIEKLGKVFRRIHKDS